MIILDERDKEGFNASNPVFTGSVSMGRKEGTVIGNHSVAVGMETTAQGNYAFAKGQLTVASGMFSSAEGKWSKATANASHAEGMDTTASNLSAHSEGYGTKASGDCAHAEGQKTEARAAGSHSEGKGTIATADTQHVQGRYNIEDTEKKYAHIVGNGTDDTERSNAHTLDWDGNAEYAGDVTANGCGGEAPISLKNIESRLKKMENVQPLILYAEKAEEYTTNADAGDETLSAILGGRQILVRVPNADGGNYTAIYSPIYFYQLPNYQNNYLYLFFLNDGVDSSTGMPTYGQLKMLLSTTYNETPLV